MAVPAALLLLTALGPLAAEQDFCIEQPESLRVRAGESVTIPCTYSYPRGSDPALVVEVSWRLSTGDRCGMAPVIYNHTQNHTHIDTNYTGRIHLVGNVHGKRSGAIQIDNLTYMDTIGKYCCRITIKNSTKKLEMWQNKHATQLVLADKPTTRVIQLDAIPARVGASVTIPCGFTYSGEVDSLNDVKVYWKAGNGSLCLEFKYIYNLTGNFEHEDYKHRVTLVTDPRGNGTSSLHITDLREADSKRYCCILRVKGKWMSSSHGTELIVGDSGLTNIIIGIVAICAFLLILILIVLFLKKKGLICKGSKDVKNEAVSPAEIKLETLTDHPKNSQHPVNSDVSQVSNVQKVDDGLLYAALNLKNASNNESRVQPFPQEETVYSAVRMK
ncbi:CD226 antigen-like isoform X2 [Pleurodeles waltl]|uniref:CD226 antigen-like isoform X2 n=1 Tax=Pleurodeles waltl TaxID=8319 RepID=UPI00370999A9